MDAIVFGTNNCGWCKKVANTLKDHQITVIKVDVIEENNLEQMKEYAGEDARTVPQVVIDGKYVGGYTETERFLNTIIKQ